MASANRPIGYGSASASQRQHGLFLSRDPVYLLGLMDNIDSDDSDDDFDGYLDDSMQSTTELQDDTSTHTLDKDNSTENFMQTNDINTTDTFTGTTNEIYLPATSLPTGQQPPVSVSVTASAELQHLAPAAETTATIQQLPPSSNSHREATATVQQPPAIHPPLQQPLSPPVAPANHQLSQVVATASPSTKLPDFTENSGAVPDMTNKQPGDFFDLIFSDDMMAHIHHETNEYAQQYIQNKEEHLRQHPHSRCAAYQRKPIELHEIKATFAIMLIMGVMSLPSLPLYWSSKWPFQLPCLTSIMSRNRFQLILKFLHFNNNSNQIPRGQPGHDRLFKIRPFLSALINKFQQLYVPFQNISIDESMIGFKGRISFLQYLPKKPNKWGMKAWALCDSKTAYVWNWRLYVGKDDEVSTSDGLGYGVVMSLVHKLANKGYHLYVDNFYSSPKLFHELYKMKIGACGTVRIDRRGIPPDFQKTKLHKGDIMTFKDGPLMGLKWMDKRQVAMLSTIHDDTTIDKHRRTRTATGGTEVIQKPKVIDEYNSYMGGVDKSDQLITYYGFSHRTNKWYKRVFFHLFEVSIVNAYILYCLHLPPKQRLSHLDFRLAVASHLLRSFFPSTPARNTHTTDSNPMRLTGRHFLALYDKAYPDCKICSARKEGKRKQTKYYCKQCNVAMCPAPCFERYHTLVNYKL